MTDINNTTNIPDQKKAKNQIDDKTPVHVDEAEERGKRPSPIGYIAGV